MDKRDIRISAEKFDRFMDSVRSSDAAIRGNHVQNDRLSAYVQSSEMDDEEADSIELHLLECDLCREELNQISEQSAPWRGRRGGAQHALALTRARIEGPSSLVRLAAQRNLPEWVRIAAIKSLGTIGGEQATRALRVAATVIEDPHLLQAVEQVVAELRISSALTRLASQAETVQAPLLARLKEWRGQISEHGKQAEAALRVALDGAMSASVSILQSLSHPSLHAAETDGLNAHLGRGRETYIKDLRGNWRGPTTYEVTTFQRDDHYTGITEQETDAVTLVIFDWKPAQLPLVVFIPVADESAVSLQAVIPQRDEDGDLVARFEHLTAGEYIIAISPVDV